jgi:hypothetical protein
MKTPTYPTQERNRRIVQLANAGIPYRTIGELSGGLSRARVQQIAKAGGYSRSPEKARDNWRRGRLERAEAKLIAALRYQAADDPESQAAIDKLMATVHNLIMASRVAK